MSNPWLGVVLFVVATAISVVAYPFLPETVPIHWNMQGEADGFAPKAVALALTPALILVFAGLLRILPAIDPKREQVRRFERSYRTVVNLILTLLLVIHAMVVANGAGWSVDVSVVLPLLIGLLFLFLGNEMPRFRQNFFLGIRTPWTVSDEEVWRQTHRVGGRVFVVGGALMMAASFLPAPHRFAVFLAAAVASSVIPVVLSFVYYRRRAR
ncbi:SdpI family protein [Calditerricola satsumensis]|uniref:Immunity protein SdpI n=1 Tax=Calditerricola satsumensis TaxID=373054 RepID=A0A8J3FCC3_9BACI|nr:SdpI family protein [Calditerricola satsumensis]GGK05521.1 immunity protein SdpI [Calditerricola satsumensis]